MKRIPKDIAEMIAYEKLCKQKYPDHYAEARFLEYGDGARAARMAAELAYIQEHNTIATWAKIIEAFTFTEDGKRVYRMFESVKPNFKK